MTNLESLLLRQYDELRHWNPVESTMAHKVAMLERHRMERAGVSKDSQAQSVDMGSVVEVLEEIAKYDPAHMPTTRVRDIAKNTLEDIKSGGAK